MQPKPNLQKLGINELNALQQEVLQTQHLHLHVIAPTGSGKTIAFLLPAISLLQTNAHQLQALIVVPMRELALQIAQVFAAMQTGFKYACCYGGHNMQTEIRSLQQTPDVIIGTPGRLQKHITSGNINVRFLKILVLDEFDKSLEIGFHDQMQNIIQVCNPDAKIILTSATTLNQMPTFISAFNWHQIQPQLTQPDISYYSAKVMGDDKAEALLLMLNHFANQAAIVFCNHRDAAQRLSKFMSMHNIKHSLYHGKLDQQQREMEWIQFANGSKRILITTDLASRGLDIAHVRNIIHYQLPQTIETDTHRNGRTARMQAKGNVYYLLDATDTLPGFLNQPIHNFQWPKTMQPWQQHFWNTVYISAGKKEGMSKTDVVGALFKKANFQKDEIGLITVFDHYMLVALKINATHKALEVLNTQKIKNKKIRASLLL
jgi:superfamily II DNA/RNA helicase